MFAFIEVSSPIAEERLLRFDNGDTLKIWVNEACDVDLLALDVSHKVNNSSIQDVAVSPAPKVNVYVQLDVPFILTFLHSSPLHKVHESSLPLTLCNSSCFPISNLHFFSKGRRPIPGP